MEGGGGEMGGWRWSEEGWGGAVCTITHQALEKV